MGDGEGFVKGLFIFGERDEVEFCATLVIEEEVTAVFEFQA